MKANFVNIAGVPRRVDHPIVVIDVLRAFTSAAWILAQGAQSLWLAETVDGALDRKRQLGEGAIAIKDGELVAGFDLGNSPGMIRQADLRGRPVVQRTMNGTVGTYAAVGAPLILCAGLCNVGATAQSVLSSGAAEVSIVITGEDGRAEEDLACGEYLAALVSGKMAPANSSQRVKRSRAAQVLHDYAIAGHPGVHRDDVELAAQINVFRFAMRAHVVGDTIQLRRENAPSDEMLGAGPAAT